MYSSKFKMSHCFCLSFTLEQFEGVRYIGLEHDRISNCWTAKFCSAKPGACTLGVAGLDYFLEQMKRQIQRYRAACDRNCLASIGTSLDIIFWAIFDVIERCSDLGEPDCVCPIEWRVHRAEIFGPILVDVAWARWAIGADIEALAKAVEDLACHVTDLCERLADREGVSGRSAKEDSSIAVRADRLAVKFFDAANDMRCNNWRKMGC